MDYGKPDESGEEQRVTDSNNDSDKDFTKEFKWGQFLTAFFGILALPIVLFAVATLINTYDISIMSMVLLLFSTIPLMAIGFFLWLALRRNNRPRALGFLFGGTLPFAILFLSTNGCGILY